MNALEMLGGVYSMGCVNESEGRSTAPDKLSRAEVGSMLAGMSDVEVCFAMARYVDDKLAVSRLKKHVMSYLLEDYHRAGKRQSEQALVALSSCVVKAAVEPCVCGRCGGTGFVKASVALFGYRVCKTCAGSGHKNQSGREVARAMEVSERDYRRKWKPLVDKGLGYLQEVSSSVERKAGRNNRFAA